MKEMFQPSYEEKENESVRLAGLFREMNSSETVDKNVFEELEADLERAGFSLAEAKDVVDVFQEQQFLCRSESFEKVIDLITKERAIKISNYENEANVCRVASGQGFRVAMTEGFSGKEVGGRVKVVITFSGDHLTEKKPLEKESRLWELKKETANVALKGRGEVSFDDLHMVSFRFPVRFFPEELLSEEEKDMLEEGRISFIVRHYTNTK